MAHADETHRSHGCKPDAEKEGIAVKVSVRLLALLLCGLTVLVFAGPCFAAETEDISALFAATEAADGAETDALAAKLGKAFQGSPAEFVELLAAENADRQKAVIDLLVFDRGGSNRDAFLETLESLADSAALSAEAKTVVHAVRTAAGVNTESPAPNGESSAAGYIVAAVIVLACVVAVAVRKRPAGHTGNE